MIRQVARLCLVALVLLSLAVAFRPGVSGEMQDRDRLNEAASAHFPAGTDELGRDRMVRSAEALLLCLSLSVVAALAATAAAAGVALAAAAGNGYPRTLILLASDSLLAVPGLFLLMMVRASLPLNLGARSTALLTFLLIAALGWPIMVRTIVAELQRHLGSDWMRYCRAQGLTRSQILRTHLAAHLLPLLRTHFLLAIPAFLVAEANLGVLGLGVPDPLPSWGGMLAQLAASSLTVSSRWRYLPAALLVGVLLLLELAVDPEQEKSTTGENSHRSDARDDTPAPDRGDLLETSA